jgi:acyl carrier protein
MTRQEIMNRTIEIVHECVPETEEQELKESTVINTDTAIDSMGFTLIICRLEAKFDVKIPQRQWSKMSTFGDVVNAFEKRINRRF